MAKPKDYRLEDDPLWYKDAVIYEVPVRAYSDSNGDGMGDFGGLAGKLDYLQELGVTAVWVLPFSPSPWKDDGYDIADFTEVHPAYGNLRDFQNFLKEAHSRGLRVVTELVLNHTSDQHLWFQRARQSPPGSKARDFYVWSDTPEKYKDARIIFKDSEPSNWSWDPAAKAYFWHRFFAHQPDLNYDDPRVRQAMLNVVDFWLKMGVDGLRLDAVPYLYEREGTNCENLPETHAFLRELRSHVDAKFRNRMLLAEANQWPEDAIAYFGEGNECNMAFHFPVMPRLFMAIRMEDRFPIFDILQQTPPIPENCQWAMFLRNHDELTLEMVTDEERDYMYRVYATEPQMRINLGIRRRLAPLMINDRRRIELMNGLLFSMPGSPVVYYGDEIGMGDNFYLGDRNGVRTPMQWSADRNAGFSEANPQRLYLPVIIDPEYHYEAINVAAQLRNPHSLLWWMKRLIAMRKGTKAFSRGTMEFLQPENRRVLAFIRRYEGRVVLVVANLSRFAQPAGLDLAEFKGLAPIEVFGNSEFPPISEQLYMISLNPYAFYWFSLEPQRTQVEYVSDKPAEESIATITVASLDDPFSDVNRAEFSRILPDFLRTRRWFGGKARRIRLAEFIEVLRFPQQPWWLVAVKVEYSEGDPDTYLLAVAIAEGEQGAAALRELAHTSVARLCAADGREAIVYGAVYDKEFGEVLLDVIARRRRIRGEHGDLFAVPTTSFRRIISAGEHKLEPSVQKVEQSNSSIIYGDRLILKLFRRLEPGINPDLEVGYFLSEKVRFPHVPPVAGALEYRPHEGEPTTVGILHGFVPNQGDAWSYSLGQLSVFFETALAHHNHAAATAPAQRQLLDALDEPIPAVVPELIGAYLESAKLLGRRTAELHLALSSQADDPKFAPEPFTDFYRQSLYHGMLGLASRSILLLRQRLRNLPEPTQSYAKKVLQLEPEIRKRFQVLRDRKISALRIRTHGDYHLGQVLYTGKDFVIIDFEGEPARPIGERRIKRSPLRDVAGMLRSFHYVAHSALYGQVAGVVARAEDREALESWARFWNSWVSLSFLKEYLATADAAPFLPGTREDLQVLLSAYLLEKAIYEISYELNNRPDWVRIPLHGILQLLGAGD
jgi:maltose alpha-D-glucosyltransferase / alpha-amylase